MAVDSVILGRTSLITSCKFSIILERNHRAVFFRRSPSFTPFHNPPLLSLRYSFNKWKPRRIHQCTYNSKSGFCLGSNGDGDGSASNIKSREHGTLGFWIAYKKSAIVALVAIVCTLFVGHFRRVFAAEVVSEMGFPVFGGIQGSFRSGFGPKLMQVLSVFQKQGLLLAILLGLSAFFSMAETSITTLWPWKVRELAEKESENGVFRMLRSDVTRFLTTILIGTTYYFTYNSGYYFLTMTVTATLKKCEGAD